MFSSNWELKYLGSLQVKSGTLRYPRAGSASSQPERTASCVYPHQYPCYIDFTFTRRDTASMDVHLWTNAELNVETGQHGKKWFCLKSESYWY